MCCWGGKKVVTVVVRRVFEVLNPVMVKLDSDRKKIKTTSA
jgi:hypothetical protein